MKKERLMELAGVQLDETVKTTKENPLVFIYDRADSPDYEEQGISGHMNLSIAAKIYLFDVKGLADKLEKAGEGKRVKVKNLWLAYSNWNKKHLKESQLNEAASVDWNDVCSVIAKEVVDSVFKNNSDVKGMDVKDREDYVMNDVGEDIDSFMNEVFEKGNIMDKIKQELNR